MGPSYATRQASSGTKCGSYSTVCLSFELGCFFAEEARCILMTDTVNIHVEYKYRSFIFRQSEYINTLGPTQV
jgi:hypothetical protein